MSLDNNIKLILDMTLSRIIGNAIGSITINETLIPVLTDADKVFSVNGTIEASTGIIEYDLANGSLKDPLGGSLSFDLVHLLFFKNTNTSESGDPHTLEFGGDGSIPIFSVDGEKLVVQSGAYIMHVSDTGIDVSVDSLLRIDGAPGETFTLLAIGQ